MLALVEIKARFDEDANIAWARKLERAGVHVVYGIVGLKTHCKLIEVVRQEQDGLKRYCHVGTGNYNPKTARLYTDLGLLTCDPVVGQDLTRLFNQLSGYAPKSSFHRLLVAPRTVRTGLIQRIRREEDAAKAGKEAWIKIKVNSLVDEKTIDALYRASQAGVKIDIVERGICALKPGVPGMSDNIRVRSILGRFLEHSRIYAFCNSDGPQIGEGPISGPEVWIGSADLMHRNLDRRVEALVRAHRDRADRRADSLCGPADVRLHGLLAHAARRHVHPSFARRRRPPAGGQPAGTSRSASTSAARAPTTDMAPGRAPDKASGTSLVHRIFRKTSGARGTVGDISRWPTRKGRPSSLQTRNNVVMQPVRHDGRVSW